MKNLLSAILTIAMLLSLAAGCRAEQAAGEADTAAPSETPEERVEPGPADKTPVRYDTMGIAVTWPEAVDALAGTLEIQPYGCVSEQPDLYYMALTYIAMPGEEYDAILEKWDDMPEEELDAARARAASLALVFGVKGATLSDALQSVRINNVDEESLMKTSLEIGTAEDYRFYLYLFPAEEIPEGFEDTYVEDYARAQENVRNAFEHAEFYAPVDPLTALIGTKVSFETTDLDGNAVSSEALFAENKITMINVWATWCPPCKGELGELAKIHERLQDKGCGIVGIVTDGTEAAETAKSLLTQNSAAYPNVCASADMGMLNAIESIPTTLFVDRDGTVLCEPIVGAQVKAYEQTVSTLLG